VVVPSLFRMRVQPHRWMTTWWWKKQRSTQSVTLVGPPSALCLTWWTWQGPGVDLGGQPGQVLQRRAGQGRGDQDRVGRVLAVRRQPPGPLADLPPGRFRDVSRGQGGGDPGVGAGPLGPLGAGGGGALGDPGVVDQPGPGAVVPVLVESLPGGERPQDPCLRQGPHRARLLRHDKELGLFADGQPGRVRGWPQPYSWQGGRREKSPANGRARRRVSDGLGLGPLTGSAAERGPDGLSVGDEPGAGGVGA
jgi:hypothetical protein